MRFAIFSDIHANLEALEAALAYLTDKAIDEYHFLGDFVNYGANPNECMEVIVPLPGRKVIGNHDRAIFDDRLLARFNPMAQESLLWTRSVLNPEWEQYLKGLSYMCIAEGYTLSHASMDCPESFDYLFAFVDAEASLEKLETPTGWIGHTHVPQIFAKKEKKGFHFPEGVYKLNEKETYLINVGSLGQPRDKDSRLAFAIYDQSARTCEMIRLEYDYQRTAQKIREAGLPDFLADRLAAGR